MKGLLLICALIGLNLNANSQKRSEYTNFYFQGNIPDSLRKYAHTVYRLDESVIDIDAPGAYTQKVHQIFTLLNKEGESKLTLRFGIDKFNKIDDVDIRIFNSLGIEVKNYRKKDFTTVPYFGGNNLFDENKITFLNMEAPSYPCTIELKYTYQVTSFISLPSWSFCEPGHSVEFSQLKVKVPQNMSIRYKMKNAAPEPQVYNENNKKIYSWEMKNICDTSKENEEEESDKSPSLLLASNDFSYDGYKGDFKDWQSFGNWNYPLYSEEKPPFSEARKEELRKMVKDAGNNRKKAEILYKYMQANMRYVSIQLGIGGFKPFPVSFVDEKKYGDCKALTNYMRYVLAEVGIKSYPALVFGGVRFKQLDPDFPMTSFNHVILCIPDGKDSVWLECTSKTNDFGVLGPFTENRYALLLTENGGKLIETPKTKAADNLFNSYTSVELDPDGAGVAHVRLSTLGQYKDDLLNYFLHEKKDDQKDYLMSEIGFKQPDEFVVAKEDSSNILKVKIDLAFERVHEFSAGSKLFLSLRLYRFLDAKLPSKPKKGADFNFDYPYIKTDTTVYVLPEGYQPDAFPKEKNLSFSYGSYATKYWFEAQTGKLYASAKLTLNSRTIPYAKFEETQKFFDQVFEDNNQKLVIKKL